MEEKHLILARYTEKVEWVNDLKMDVFIYNKGEKLQNIQACILDMPNIGREPYAYLIHILSNYESLANINIFSQADPFDHISGVKEILSQNSIENMYNEFCNRNSGIEGVRYDSFAGFGEKINVTNFHLQSAMVEDFFNKFCNSSLKPYARGAIFAVSKRKILQHSKDYYLSLLNWMVGKYTSINEADKWNDKKLDWWWPPGKPNSIWWPIGHVFELLWPTIFHSYYGKMII